tara:strand:- start:58896 stop:61241 length:2346 start_codon:yes stop_codon:yes gene_type:complete
MPDSESMNMGRRGPFVILADWIIGHRWLTLALITALTIFSGIGHYDPYLILPDSASTDAEPQRTQTSNTKRGGNKAPKNVSPIQVAAGDVVIVARCDQFFTRDGADAIRDSVSAVKALPQVADVFWMDEAPMLNIFGLPEPIFPQGNASQTRFDSAKERALEHPLVGGQLLSPDANTMLLMVSINWLFVNEDSDCTDALRDAAAAAAAHYPAVDMDFAVTGEVPIMLSRASSNLENERKYQFIGFSMALCIAWVLFRGISSVIIVALAPALGVFWTLGIIHFTSMDGNPFNAVIVPVLLSMVGFTDGVHMMVQVRRHRADGMTAREAARTSIREVGIACWLTSLTTAIGFGSLALAHHEQVREFGYCCVIGVLMTFLAVVTIIPLACASPLGNRVHSGHGKNLIDNNLDRIVGLIDWVMKYPRGISAFAILCTLGLAVVTLQLRPDERLTSNLSAGSEPATALAHIDRTFGGMETAHVQVDFAESDIRDNDAAIATVVEQVDQVLRSEPLIGNPLSINSFLRALPGDGDPATRMSLLELLPPGLKRNYLSPEQRWARVEFRLQDLGIATYGPVFQRITDQLHRIEDQHPGFTVSLSGGAIWRWENLYQIVVDLAYSLGMASLIIFGVMTIVYRSVRLGLISLIPNIFPLAATGALLFCVGQHLEIVSVCAFTVCLGIAVDDTIHFLTRYREQLADKNPDAADSQRSAIRNAFVGVGSALIMTTAVLVIGFGTALTSDARDHRIFAAMGMLTISTALLADLLFLPALLLRFAPSEQRSSSNR